MRFNICTNLDNGAGLQRDYQIMRAALEQHGHEVRGLHFLNINDRANADVNIFLETIRHDLFEFAREQWFVPNPEWFQPNLINAVRRFTGILAKTHDCEAICRRLYPTGGPRIIYSSWESPDLFDSTIPREPHFLHVAGNSQTKNTAPIFNAWRSGCIPARLTVISRWYPNPGIPNVTVLQRVSDNEHKMLINRSLYHLAPSQYEGFGHSLNEALGVGAIVVSLNAPPMNEFGIVPELLVPSHGFTMYNQGPLHAAHSEDIINAALASLNLSEEQRRATSEVNRAGFLARREHFHKTVSDLWGNK